MSVMWRRHTLMEVLCSPSSSRLDANRIVSVPPRSFNGLLSLRHLWLDDNALTEVPVPALAGLSSLQAMTLALNRISHIPDGAFTNLSSLVVLWVPPSLSATSLYMGTEPWTASCFPHSFIREERQLNVGLKPHVIEVWKKGPCVVCWCLCTMRGGCLQWEWLFWVFPEQEVSAHHPFPITDGQSASPRTPLLI